MTPRAFGFLLLEVVWLLFGGMVAGIGTLWWTSAAIEPTSGAIERQWELPDPSSLGVSCTTQLRTAVAASVNVTVAGPCPDVPIGSVVPLCRPRGRPDRAVVKCETMRAVALVTLVLGWAVVAASAATLAATCCLHRTRRGGEGSGGTATEGRVPPGRVPHANPSIEIARLMRFRREDSDTLLLPVNIGVPANLGGAGDEERMANGFRREDSDTLLLPVNIGVPVNQPFLGGGPDPEQKFDQNRTEPL